MLSLDKTPTAESRIQMQQLRERWTHKGKLFYTGGGKKGSGQQGV